LTAVWRAASLFVIAGASTAVAEIVINDQHGSVGSVTVRSLAIGGAFALFELARAWYRAQYGS
jgi:hypothetical protein